MLAPRLLGIPLVEPCPGIAPLELGQRVRGHLALAPRTAQRPVECLVVQHHEHRVLRALQILLDEVRTKVEREVVRHRRVLGGMPRGAAMRHDRHVARVWNAGPGRTGRGAARREGQGREGQGREGQGRAQCGAGNSASTHPERSPRVRPPRNSRAPRATRAHLAHLAQLARTARTARTSRTSRALRATRAPFAQLARA